MTTITANFGTHTETVTVPDTHADDTIYDFFLRGAILVQTKALETV